MASQYDWLWMFYKFSRAAGMKRRFQPDMDSTHSTKVYESPWNNQSKMGTGERGIQTKKRMRIGGMSHSQWI